MTPIRCFDASNNYSIIVNEPSEAKNSNVIAKRSWRGVALRKCLFMLLVEPIRH